MKKKIFKLILFVLIFFVVIRAIIFGYKYFWFSKLIKAEEDLIASGNFTQKYSNVGISYDGETGEKIVSYSAMEAKIKDGKRVDIRYDDNGKITSKAYYIGDTGVLYVCDEEKEFDYYTSSSLYGFNDIRLDNYPIYIMKSYHIMSGTGEQEEYETSLREKLWCMRVNFGNINRQKISLVTEDGKDYIVLSAYGARKYFDRETLLGVKTVIESNTGALNGEDEYVNYYYEYTQGDVTDADMTPPDLSEYTQIVNGWVKK